MRFSVIMRLFNRDPHYSALNEPTVLLRHIVISRFVIIYQISLYSLTLITLPWLCIFAPLESHCSLRRARLRKKTQTMSSITRDRSVGPQVRIGLGHVCVPRSSTAGFLLLNLHRLGIGQKYGEKRHAIKTVAFFPTSHSFTPRTPINVMIESFISYSILGEKTLLEIKWKGWK